MDQPFYRHLGAYCLLDFNESLERPFFLHATREGLERHKASTAPLNSRESRHIRRRRRNGNSWREMSAQLSVVKIDRVDSAVSRRARLHEISFGHNLPQSLRG